MPKNSNMRPSPSPNSRHTLRWTERSLRMLRIIEVIKNTSDPRATSVTRTIIQAPALM